MKSSRSRRRKKSLPWLSEKDTRLCMPSSDGYRHSWTYRTSLRGYPFFVWIDQFLDLWEKKHSRLSPKESTSYVSIGSPSSSLVVYPLERRKKVNSLFSPLFLPLFSIESVVIEEEEGQREGKEKREKKNDEKKRGGRRAEGQMGRKKSLQERWLLGISLPVSLFSKLSFSKVRRWPSFLPKEIHTREQLHKRKKKEKNKGRKREKDRGGVREASRSEQQRKTRERYGGKDCTKEE